MMPYSARVPLLEKTSSATLGNRANLGPQAVYKMKTPPQLFTQKPFDTPLTNLDPAIAASTTTGHVLSQGVPQSLDPMAMARVPPAPNPSLLLPAFLSPDQYPGAPKAATTYRQICIDPSLTNAREKKRKKTKKEIKEEAFDLLSDEKPPYSYATLIGISILSHADKKLTLLQIYQWISDTFKYYKRQDVGWQNLIRHNLSLNKAFVKGEKLKDGKGHFWCIKPGCEEQFLKLKTVRKLSYHEVMEQIKQKQAPVALPSSPPLDEPTQPINYKKRTLDELALEASSKRQKLGEPFADGDNNSDSEKAPTTNIVIDDSMHTLSCSSSFSYSSNLELSPTRPNDPGPLLEPLTPALLGLKIKGSMLKPPQLTAGLLVTPQLQNTPKVLKTPLRNLKTPQTQLIVRKMWNLPSYLEEFYSPLVHAAHGGRPTIFNLYDDEDMVLRPVHQSPAFRGRPDTQLSPTMCSLRNLMFDFKRAQLEEEEVVNKRNE